MGTHISGGGIEVIQHCPTDGDTDFRGGIDSNTTLSDRWGHRFQEKGLTVIHHCPTGGEADFRRGK